jgi:PEP-CTERM motif
MMKLRIVAIQFVLALALVPTVRADGGAESTIYTFTGGLLSGCNCNLTGEVTVAGPPQQLPTGLLSIELVPTSFSFSVHGFTLNQDNTLMNTPTNNVNFGLFLGQDAWTINLQQNSNPQLFIFSDCVDGCGDDSSTFASIRQLGANGVITSEIPIGSSHGLHGNGSWSVSVPEPGTLLLLGTGFAALGLGFRRRAA